MNRASPAWFHAMPLHQKQSLWAWLTTGGPRGNGIGARAARRRLAAEFGVTVSAEALLTFCYRYPAAAGRARRDEDGSGKIISSPNIRK